MSTPCRPAMTLPRRSEADPRAILARLAPDRAGEPLAELGEGWDNVVYAVGPALVLRVAKEADPERRRAKSERDLALLRIAADHSTLPVPAPVAADTGEGALLCRRVLGVPAVPPAPYDPVPLGRALGTFARAIHAVPLDLARSAVDPEPDSDEDWLVAVRQEFDEARDRVDGLLVPEIDAFLAGPWPTFDGPGVFCHNDIRDEHVMLDETSEVVGVIDWGDAMIGDPARDFATVLTDFGDVAYASFRAAYGPIDAGVDDRARYIGTLRTVEGLAYYVRIGKASGQLQTTETLLRQAALEGE